MSYVPGEANIVLSIPAPAGTHEDTLLAAERIDCVALVNTDTLIQAHFPDYLRNWETWMERPGWNGEYYRYLPDLRLRCLLVLARYAAGWTDGIRPADVEAIPDARPTAVLEAELVTHLRTLADTGPMDWGYDPDRAGPTEDMQPPWETDPARALRLLYEALVRRSGATRPASLAGFPGRTVIACVRGHIVQWDSVHVFFLMPVGRCDHGEVPDDGHWMTRAIKRWLIDNAEAAAAREPRGPDNGSNVFDLRCYRRSVCDARPRHARTAWIYFTQSPSHPPVDGPQVERQFRREAEGSWAGYDPRELRREYAEREARLEIIERWQTWEGSGKTYIYIPGYGRIFLWKRRGPGYPSVITPKDIETPKEELDRPRFGFASNFARPLAVARFRYGIPDLDWSEFMSGSFRKRDPRTRRKR